MTPLVACTIFGVLALFRFESAKGAETLSDEILGSVPPSSSRLAARAVGGEGGWSGTVVGSPGAASALSAGEPTVASPQAFVEEQFKFLDSEGTGQASPSTDASPVDVSVGPRHSLFPQCWLTEREKRETPEAEEHRCRVVPSTAFPPSRHPWLTVEYARAKHLPFSMRLPQWNAVVVHAMNERESIALWQLEVLHKFLWLRAISAREACERFRPNPDNIRSLLFELLDLEDALLYAEGFHSFSSDVWYLELDAAIQVARNRFDDALLLLEQVFRPEFPESESGHSTAASAVSKSQTKNKFHCGDEAEEEAKAGGAKDTVVALEGEEPSRPDLVRQSSGSKLLIWARHITAVATEAARTAADTVQKFPVLVSDADVLNLRLFTNRIMDLFGVRQKPLPMPYTVTRQADPTRLFRFQCVEALAISIPCNARSRRRQDIIRVLRALVENSLAVTSQHASHPQNIHDFVLLITKLSKSIRAVLGEKHRVPRAWKAQVDELLGHAYARLELLLSQRTIFMRELPYQ